MSLRLRSLPRPLRSLQRTLRTRRKLGRRRRRHWRARLRGLRRYPLVLLEDRRRNRPLSGVEPRFLVVRHSSLPGFFDPFLDWLEAELPEVRQRFELRLLPCRVRDWSPYALHVPWLQDPVQAWSRRAYARALTLGKACDSHGIPIVNRVDKLPNAAKSEAARRLHEAGLRTPRMARIEDAAAFRETLLDIPLPLFVREDWGHGGPVFRVDRPRDAEKIPLHLLARPVAIEIVDVRSPDGLYRKYRYLVAGDAGIPQQLHVSTSWITRGSRNPFSEGLRDEEVAHIEGPNPHHDAFQQARKALELDFVAFDYGIEPSGSIVVWEANPFPYIQVPRGRRSHRAPAVERAFAGMTRLYLERADLAVPSRIDEVLHRR